VVNAELKQASVESVSKYFKNKIFKNKIGLL